MNNQCIFSPCRKYRYLLRHGWEELFPENAILWIGLNPSTADESQLDPTLRRIKGYSIREGFNCFYMANLFGFRSTDPSGLREVDDPTGEGNDAAILQAAGKCKMIVAAWGGHGKYLDRARQVVELLSGRELLCLSKTSSGEPGHPLYLPASAQFVPL